MLPCRFYRSLANLLGPLLELGSPEVVVRGSLLGDIMIPNLILALIPLIGMAVLEVGPRPLSLLFHRKPASLIFDVSLERE